MINNDIVPEGWVLITIEEVVHLNPPKPPKNLLPSKAQVTFVPMPAVDASLGKITQKEKRPFSAVDKGYTAFRENDVIMAKITPCMENGKAAIARGLENGLGFGSTEFHVIRSRGAILPEFIYYFIRQESFRKAAEGEMTGSVGQKRVPADFLRNSEILLPPLAEQKRIVKKVEGLIERVNAVKKRLAKASEILKRFRQSVLAAACSGRLTEKWRVTAMGEKAATWQQKEFFELCVLQRGYDLPKSKHKEGPFPIMTSGGIFGHHSEYKAKGPGVLIGRSGSIGKSFYIDENYWPHNTTLFVKDFKGNFPKYVFYFLQGFNFHPFSASTAVPTLNRNNLRGLTISVPHFKEQHEIVDRIETLFNLADFIEERITSAGARAEKLTQAILAKAFRGELVPTEAELARREGRSYEPAFDLLARIKEEYKGEEKRGISRINKNS